MSIKSQIKHLFKAILQRYLARRNYVICNVKNTEHFSSVPYHEREEYGASNLKIKLDRKKRGEPFEYPDIINLNIAVSHLSTGFSRIVELGSGTGKYIEMMSKDPQKYVVGSEYDVEANQWCIDNLQCTEKKLFVSRQDPAHFGPYDLSVAIEVVEHVADYTAFLQELARLAPTSIITTPNRARSAADYHSGPPVYYQHVREWTAGEFYWILRSFWNNVDLYAVLSVDSPAVQRVSVDTTLSPLIAICKNPLGQSA